MPLEANLDVFARKSPPANSYYEGPLGRDRGVKADQSSTSRSSSRARSWRDRLSSSHESGVSVPCLAAIAALRRSNSAKACRPRCSASVRRGSRAAQMGPYRLVSLEWPARGNQPGQVAGPHTDPLLAQTVGRKQPAVDPVADGRRMDREVFRGLCDRQVRLRDRLARFRTHWRVDEQMIARPLPDGTSVASHSRAFWLCD